jgi:hypothetical protein
MVDQPQNCGKLNPKEETVLNIFDAYHKTKALAIFLIDVWWHQRARRLSQNQQLTIQSFSDCLKRNTLKDSILTLRVLFLKEM